MIASSSNQDSHYINKLLLCLYTPAVLVTKSVTGQSSRNPKYEQRVKAKITPQKYKFIVGKWFILKIVLKKINYLIFILIDRFKEHCQKDKMFDESRCYPSRLNRIINRKICSLMPKPTKNAASTTSKSTSEIVETTSIKSTSEMLQTTSETSEVGELSDYDELHPAVIESGVWWGRRK